MTKDHCGYVGIVGRPNVGKSTLLNHIMGIKLSITSRKPQTTRTNLIGVSTRGSTQILFVDTPGIHSPGVHRSTRAMNRYMVNQALGVLRDLDLALFVVDAQVWTDADQVVLDHIKKHDVRTICCPNKIDRLKRKDQLLPYIDGLSRRHAFEAIVPISALRNDGLDELLDEIIKRMPEGPHLFDDEAVTDRPAEFLIAEAIREKVMRQLGDELPYRAAVSIEQFERRGEITHIDAVIFVERDSQKSIVIGKDGGRLKSIGQEARKEIEPIVGGRVMLSLWVKVRPGWSKSDESLHRQGYR